MRNQLRCRSVQRPALDRTTTIRNARFVGKNRKHDVLAGMLHSIRGRYRNDGASHCRRKLSKVQISSPELSGMRNVIFHTVKWMNGCRIHLDRKDSKKHTCCNSVGVHGILRDTLLLRAACTWMARNAVHTFHFIALLRKIMSASEYYPEHAISPCSFYRKVAGVSL